MIAQEIWTLVAVAVGGGVQAIAGLGFGLICAPFLSVLLGASEGVRLSNLLGTGLNVLVLMREWRTARLRDAALLLAPALFAVPMAGWALTRAAPWLLSITTGALVLTALLAVVAGAQLEALRGARGVLIAGSVSGAMNVIGGVGGPAVVSYAANARWPTAHLRPTLAAYFLCLNAMSIAVRGLPSVTALSLMTSSLALVAGVALGMRVEARMNRALVRRGTFIVSAFGALASIVQGLSELARS